VVAVWGFYNIVLHAFGDNGLHNLLKQVSWIEAASGDGRDGKPCAVTAMGSVSAFKFSLLYVYGEQEVNMKLVRDT
jgi:hypothetical protein